MTRFARGGEKTKKKPHDPTEWNGMFQEGSSKQTDRASPHANTRRNSNFKSDRKNLSGVNKDRKSRNFNSDRQNNKTWNNNNQRSNQGNRSQGRGQNEPSSSNKLVCFNCRQSGHRMENCPQIRKDAEQATGICFKCGSTEHNSKSCKSKSTSDDFPFAKCFICGEVGHISRQCPDNPRGLYPNGGCCVECGSVEHYKKDCKESERKQGIESMTLGVLTELASADTDGIDSLPVPKPKKITGPKIVKF